MTDQLQVANQITFGESVGRKWTIRIGVVQGEKANDVLAITCGPGFGSMF